MRCRFLALLSLLFGFLNLPACKRAPFETVSESKSCVLNANADNYHCFEWVVSDSESRKVDCAASAGTLSDKGCDNLLASRICKQRSKTLPSSTGAASELLNWFGPKNSATCDGEVIIPPKPVPEPAPDPDPRSVPPPEPGPEDSKKPVEGEKSFFGSYRSGCVAQAQSFFASPERKAYESWILNVFVTGGELVIEHYADKECTQKYMEMIDRVEFRKEGEKQLPVSLDIVDRSRDGRWRLALHEPQFVPTWKKLKLCGFDDWTAFAFKDFADKTLLDCPMGIGDAEENPETDNFIEFYFKLRRIQSHPTRFDPLRDALSITFFAAEIELKVQPQ